MATSTANYSQSSQKEISSFLTFEEDVVLTRCPDMISYSKMFKNCLKNKELIFSGCLQEKSKTRNAFIKKTKWHPPKRKPINMSAGKKIRKSAVLKSKNEFLPILPPVAKYLKQKGKSSKEDIDSHQGIPVTEEKTIMAPQRDMAKLSECKKSVSASSTKVDISGQGIFKDSQFKTWNKKDASLLSELFKRTDFMALTMREKKETHLNNEEQAERVNQSALAINVKPTKVLPSKTLKDVLNHKVGNTVLHPSNTFQVELLTGVPLIYDPSKKDIIVTGTETQYQKYQQQEYPPLPDEWYPTVSKNSPQRGFQAPKSAAKSLVPEITKFHKGFIRWVALPEVMMDTKVTGIDHLHRIKEKESYAQPKLNPVKKSSLEQVLDMWQLKWQLPPGLTSASLENIFLDMADLHPNVRCLALITATKIGVQCKCSSSQPNDSMKAITRKNKNDLPDLLDTITSAVQCMLGDPHENVKMAAALAMFCLEQKNDKAESVVRTCLSSHNILKRWVAALCLGHSGCCDSDVISEVIQQTFASTDTDQVAQGIHLLIKLSKQSSLIQSLVAEHLNSNRWQSKIMACQLFPQLHSHITKDISDKIKCLMWSDWHPEVRLQAAHCLGRTKQGKGVHDDLLLKLKHPDSQVRIKAIRLIGHLGMMTRKLALQFLQCFDDAHVSVRCEICIACGKLQIADTEVLDKLVDIATHDPLWKLKALAIQALGQIGVCTEEIKNCLLWSVHYSNHFAIRAEACRSLRLLREQSPEVVLTLQERFLVENEPSVKKQLQKSLMEISGWSPVDEIDEVQKVKHAVRMLSTPHSVKQRVILMDYCRQAQLQPTSLDCISQVISGMDLSKMKFSIPSSTSPSNTTEPQREYPEEAVKDKDKIAQMSPLFLPQNVKTGISTTETKKGNQSKDDPSKDPSCQKAASKQGKSDFHETRTFLTEVDPQILSLDKHKMKETKTDIKNKNKIMAQKKKKTHDYSSTYKNLIESLPNFACDSTQMSESSQDRISDDTLNQKSFIKKDSSVECFNELFLRYSDLFIEADTFPSEKDYREGSM